MSPTSLHSSLNFSAGPAAATNAALGDLPAWKLSDLYPSATSTAFVSDMEKAGKAAIAFEEKWKGKLADAATKTGDAGIGAALTEYEALDDIIGRLGSFAGLMAQSPSDASPAEIPAGDLATARRFGERIAKVVDRWANVR